MLNNVGMYMILFFRSLNFYFYVLDIGTSKLFATNRTYYSHN